MARPKRIYTGSDRQAYLWENIPRSLIQRAIEKGRREIPSVSLRVKLYELLKAWVDSEE